ncbi:MAG: hypothetical protein AAF383_24185 [Cyanobacteria bacterium P01_A01_bin.83]
MTIILAIALSRASTIIYHEDDIYLMAGKQQLWRRSALPIN